MPRSFPSSPKSVPADATTLSATVPSLCAGRSARRAANSCWRRIFRRHLSRASRPSAGRVLWREGEHGETQGDTRSLDRPLVHPGQIRWPTERRHPEPSLPSEWGSSPNSATPEAAWCVPARRPNATCSPPWAWLPRMTSRRQRRWRLGSADWLNPLPPILVVRTDTDIASGRPHPASGHDGEMTWRLALEDGEQRTGRVAFGELAWTASQ